jgi:hypothetical protein
MLLAKHKHIISRVTSKHMQSDLNSSVLAQQQHTISQHLHSGMVAWWLGSLRLNVLAQ